MADNMAAFLTAWQHNEACCWAPRPDSELIFTPLPSPKMALKIFPAALRDTFLRQALTRRFQHPDRYDGCYISVDADGSLTMMCQPAADDDLHDTIDTLCSLADW